jgi:hypothetical protein
MSQCLKSAIASQSLKLMAAMQVLFRKLAAAMAAAAAALRARSCLPLLQLQPLLLLL